MKSCIILIFAHSANFCFLCKKLDARLFYHIFHENDIRLNYPDYHQFYYPSVNSMCLQMFLNGHTMFQKCVFFFVLLSYCFTILIFQQMVESLINFCSNSKFDTKLIEKIVTLIREFFKNGIMYHPYNFNLTNFSFLCTKLDACLLILSTMLIYYIILTSIFQYIIKKLFF